MNRNAYLVWTALAALLLTACGDGADADAGTDADVTADTGVRDSGVDPEDSGVVTDSGVEECVDCEYVEVALGILHACGRRANGQVFCWGRNQESQIGDGRTRHENCAAVGSDPEDCTGSPEQARYDDGSGRPALDDAEQLSIRGFGGSCALRPGGELWCWGRETIPDVVGGISDIREVGERDFPSVDGMSSVSVGDGHLCFASGAESAAFCAGNGARGQLGHGMRPEIVIDPVQVIADTTTGAQLTGVEEIVVSGFSFTCARTADDVYCWGRNQRGQLGDPDDMGRASVHESCVVDSTEMWDCASTPVVVGGDTPLGTVSDIDLGSQHVCAVQGSGPGQVVCWGENRGRQAGQADADSVPAPSAVAGLDDAVMVATGSNHSCALRSDGTVACWGLNRDGQLGDGMASHGTSCMLDSENVDCSATPVEVATIDDATFIAARASFTCVTRGGDGSVWCWGNNNNKQLGDGTRDNRFGPVMVMGTAAP